MTLVAKKGEKVTCTNGHVICEVVDDLYVGRTLWGDCFGAWRQPPPVPGTTDKPPCIICGAPFIASDSWAFHYEDGTWR